MSAQDDPIKHVIVLMLENRSFDQMLGACQKFYDDLDGVDPRKKSRVNWDDKSKPYEQLPDASYYIKDDPHHSLKSVLKQVEIDWHIPDEAVDDSWCDRLKNILRLPKWLTSKAARLAAWATVSTLAHEKWQDVKDLFKSKPVGRAMQQAPYVGHFVEAFIDDHPNSEYEDRMHVMRYFTLGDLPALHTLAQHFKVCNRWYSSVPGPTWANRLFLHSGTSMGTTSMPESGIDLHNILRFNQRTLYDEISDSDKELDWHIYFHDFPQCLALENLRDNKYSDKFDRIAKLESDFQKPSKDFPAFVFIEPQYFGDGNDDHPPNNSLPAQELVARVYNALRANEGLWNESLLIVTYDEHGGFYDHREPPDAVPPGGPCVTTTPDYTYDRLGVRVPALLISPWVTPGVFSTQLDHTSVGKYLCEKWGLTPLGDRMKEASSFADAIDKRKNPRANTPERIEVERLAARAKRLPESEQMNENQRALVALADFCTPQEKLMRGPAASEKPSPEEMAERALRFLGKS